MLRNIYQLAFTLTRQVRKLNNQLNLLPSNKIGLIDLNNEFCKETLSAPLGSLSGKRVMFSTDSSKEQLALCPLSAGDMGKVPYVLQAFSPTPRERIVASVDSSCALIGETEEGSIYAGRVTTVFSSKGVVLSYQRAGPIIFYLDPTTVETGFGSLCQAKRGLKSILLDRSVAERSIRIFLERKAQIRAAESLSDSIVVVDGSLRGSLLEQKGATIKKLEEEAERNFNQLVGFSKASSIRLISSACSFLQTCRRSMVYIDLTEFAGVLLPYRNPGSRITVAKFSPGVSVFRLDTSSANTEDASQVYSDLKYNDSFFRGYPETLRLAHHLSILDSSIISSIRSYLSKEYGLVQVPSDDLRATILGKLV